MNRLPLADEYPDYYAGYVAHVQDPDVLSVLRRQLDDVLTLLARLDDDQALHRYAPGKWSIKEVLGHVIDSERVFAYRALCFARGEGQAQPGFEQDEYVAIAGFDERSLVGLVEEYRAVRGATLTLFEGLDAAAWERWGTANEVRFTVRALAFITAGHEAHHLGILRERYLPGLRSG